MKQGKKQFEKDIKAINEVMQAQFKKLSDENSRLQYLMHMKKPAQRGSTANRLSLLLQNKSLIMMQFASGDQMPSEEDI